MKCVRHNNNCLARLTMLVAFGVLAIIPLQAQDTSAPKSQIEVAKKTLTTARKQIPTTKAAAEEQAIFLKNNAVAAPLPAGSPKLAAMRKRSAALLKKHTAYMKDVAAGKIDPHAHLRQARPQHLLDVQGLKNLIGKMSNETNLTKRAKIGNALFLALQPIGAYLEMANVAKGYANILSKGQQAELARLEKAWSAAATAYPENVTPLTTLGKGHYYTLTNLSVPITVKSPPGSTVILRSHGGGFFSNKLSVISVKADQSGIATANWITYGDSVGDTQISIRSTSAPSAHNLTITTVQPKLRGLPSLPVNAANN